MHSCSKLLCAKHSKPNMSSTPMLDRTSAASTWMDRFIVRTIQSNSRPYRALARASLASHASVRVSFFSYESSLATIVRTVRQRTTLSTSSPNSCEANSRLSAHSSHTAEPSPSADGTTLNCTCPRCSSAAATSKSRVWSSGSKLSVFRACFSPLNSAPSSMLLSRNTPPLLAYSNPGKASVPASPQRARSTAEAPAAIW
mmetsp:Transcript_6872/g.14916  ORF Transcript_6872/g.14916 Transcript_6872/m.14916 type:complete len:200 (-) Transcript_6872:1087-1686(-)